MNTKELLTAIIEARNDEKELTRLVKLATPEQLELFIDLLEKALHSPRNRTEPTPNGDLLHSHYTTENSNYKEKMKNEF